MERSFEIKTLPYLPDLHAWLGHTEGCGLCTDTYERLSAGEDVPVTAFCIEGVGIFIAFMNAIDHQHFQSLWN